MHGLREVVAWDRVDQLHDGRPEQRDAVGPRRGQQHREIGVGRGPWLDTRFELAPPPVAVLELHRRRVVPRLDVGLRDDGDLEVPLAGLAAAGPGDR